MPCVHLRKLYELCDENQLEFSSSDLVRIVCKQCEREEVCPSVLVADYSSRHPPANSDGTSESEHQDSKTL